MKYIIKFTKIIRVVNRNWGNSEIIAFLAYDLTRVVNGEIFFFFFRCIIILNDLFLNFLSRSGTIPQFLK